MALAHTGTGIVSPSSDGNPVAKHVSLNTRLPRFTCGEYVTLFALALLPNGKKRAELAQKGILAFTGEDQA